MKLKELKIVFNAGALKEAIIRKAIMNENWNLLLCNKNDEVYIFDSQREEKKEFNTIDSAVKIAREIGFKKIKIEL